MTLTRREFLEGSLGTLSVLAFSFTRVSDAQGRAIGEPPAEIPVVWLATGACSGCSVALLNSASPTIQELLLDEILPGQRLSLAFHSTLMAGSGEAAMRILEELRRDRPGGYVLVVDGAVATRDDGLYCVLGELEGRQITGYEAVRDVGRDALAVLAVGACAGFGGIPAAPPNPTDCLRVQDLFDREGIATPVVNIPGCPPHPDWIVGTVATLLLGGPEALALDTEHRPAPFFRELVHDSCPYRGLYDRGQFAERFGEHGCLLKLGCKGPITYADCPIRKFNNGTSWCCEVGHPCIGCCHPEFPFEGSVFAPVEPAAMNFPALYPCTDDATARRKADTDTYVTLGLIGVGAFAAGVGVTHTARKLKHMGEPEGETTDEGDER